jgi:transposase InsO family protein
VSGLRKLFIQQVTELGRPLAAVCREHGISRKTGYKWLARYRQTPEESLADQSRRPRASPRRTADGLERQVLDVREKFGWGARKIRAYLMARDVSLPSVATVNAILRRHGQIAAAAEPADTDWQCFVRSQPNELWQCDHKGPLEVGRQKIFPLSVIDDHSRFLLALDPCLDLTMKTAFGVLWNAFGEFGLPDSILCDNAFGTKFTVPKTLSWFDARLVRLGVRPLHGKPYHPQTQGKVERFHGALERELWPRVRRDELAHFQEDSRRWRTEVYNLVRPHESLQDQPPAAIYRPSLRARPNKVPEVEYPAGAVLRKVTPRGEVYWKNCRIMAGYGLVGEHVRIEEREHEIALHYAWKEIRLLANDQLRTDKIL